MWNYVASGSNKDMKTCVANMVLIGRHKHSVAQEGEKIMLYDDAVSLKCTGSFYRLLPSYLMPT